MKIVGIIGRKGGARGSAYTEQEHLDLIIGLTKAIEASGHRVFLDEDSCGAFINQAELSRSSTTAVLVPFFALVRHIKLGVVLGGDGTMLDAAQQLAKFNIPVVGVNQGKLGFITDVPRETCIESVINILEGRSWDETRSLLFGFCASNTCEKIRDIETEDLTALNDIVIQRDVDSSVIRFEVYIGNDFAYETRADGLIICTPTGSTAYNMSAGGSIMHPSSKVFGLVPMMPQTLSYRPLIVSDDQVIAVAIRGGTGIVTFDGQPVYKIKNGSQLVIRKASHSVTFVHPNDYDYLNTLREKLGWHVEPRFKNWVGK